MSRLSAAWERAEEFKRRWAGQGPVESAAHAAVSGERWVTALFEHHGLADSDIDVVGEIIRKVGGDTVVNVGRLHVQGELDLDLMLAAIFAAGFANGLAVGLELDSK